MTGPSVFLCERESKEPGCRKATHLLALVCTEIALADHFTVVAWECA